MIPPNPHFKKEPDFRRLLIFGAGGFGREVAWLADQCWGDSVEKIFVVDKEEFAVGPIADLDVILLANAPVDAGACATVALGNPAHKRQAAHACEQKGLRMATLIHPRAEMSRTVAIGEGSIVCAGTIATTDIHIGRHVHINLDCTLGHDVRIGDFTTLSPGVHVSGNVQIGHDVFIGTGASIINGSSIAPLIIGNGSTIAAGACVIRQVAANTLVAGVPAIQKR